MEALLSNDNFLLSEDFGLLATEEKEVITHLVPTAKSRGVPTESLVQVNVKKLWKLCRQENKTGIADSSQGYFGQEEKTKKVCEQVWLRKHSNTLLAGRILVSKTNGTNAPSGPRNSKGLQDAIAQTDADSRR